MTNQNFKPTKRMTVFLSRDEQRAIKIAVANEGGSINNFLRDAVKSKLSKMGIDFESGEVKK